MFRKEINYYYYKCVQAAAQQAQANAAAAAAKAAAAGLSAGQGKHDASHEGTSIEEHAVAGAGAAPQAHHPYYGHQSNYQHQ